MLEPEDGGALRQIGIFVGFEGIGRAESSMVDNARLSVVI
jgi:hypothetical protein